MAQPVTGKPSKSQQKGKKRAKKSHKDWIEFKQFAESVLWHKCAGEGLSNSWCPYTTYSIASQIKYYKDWKDVTKIIKWEESQNALFKLKS